MSDVIVKPVSTRSERKAFLDLPWRLYRDDPNWTSPLRLNQKELVGYRKHPFFEENEAQTFLAWRGGQPCGRIAAILDRGHNRYHKENRGFFGFYESVNDRAVAHALLDAARDWHAVRGIRQLRGPVNPSLNYECGLLVDGFDTPATFMMTYNPPYYADQIESYGYVKSQDLLSFAFSAKGAITDKAKVITDIARQRFNVHIRPLDKKRFAEEVDTFLRLYNAGLAGNWGFVPLSPGEVRHLAASLQQLIVPELTAIAEVDGKVVGACICLLDYNPRIKQIDGRLLPFGFLKLLTNRRAIKRIRAIAATVMPEFHGWGLGLVILDWLLPKALAWGVEEGECSWVLESNRLSRRSLEKGGAKLIKTHRLYDYDGDGIGRGLPAA